MGTVTRPTTAGDDVAAGADEVGDIVVDNAVGCAESGVSDATLREAGAVFVAWDGVVESEPRALSSFFA